MTFQGWGWMYERRLLGGVLNSAFTQGVQKFLNFAYTLSEVRPNMTI